MDKNLTPNFISFFQPLLLKSFRLFVFTNRTISLLFFSPINFIKSVSVFTMSPFRIYCSYGVRILQRIFSHSYNSQMFWIYTVSNFTYMVHHKISRYISSIKKYRYSMGFSLFSLKKKCTIPIFIEITLPYMTTSPIYNILSAETLKVLFIYIFHATHYTPSINQTQYAK